MLPKPKTEEQHNPEHNKTDDQTPSPTEIADSPVQIDHEAEWERTIAYKNTDGNDDDFDDGMATDEAAAITEAMAEAVSLNTTLQCHIGAKRQHEDDAQPEVPQQV